MELFVVNDWKIIRLGDVCTKIGSGATPRGGNEVYLSQSEYTLIRSQNVYNDGFHHDGLAYISKKHALELSNVEVFPGDILLNITGDSVARACQVDKSILPARVNQHVSIIRPDRDVLDARFLRYILISPKMQTKLKSWAGSGGTRNALTKGMIESLEIFVPKNISVQRAIAHILGTLDDKIELNRRMSETLEDIARALFKSWFIDFDPVRAKMASRDPGLPPHIADLFPDRLVDSELGEIPEGWMLGCYGDIISQRTARVGDKDAVVLSAVASGKLIRSDDHFTKQVYSKELNKYLLVKQWDLAYNPSRINIGSIGMLEEPIVGGVSPVYVVIRPNSSYRWFLEFSIRRSFTKKWINTLASGSVRQSLSYTDFASIPCIIPSDRIVKEFDLFWIKLRELLFSRENESQSLISILEQLLPKLISGELRIHDADWIVRRTL